MPVTEKMITSKDQKIYPKKHITYQPSQVCDDDLLITFLKSEIFIDNIFYL